MVQKDGIQEKVWIVSPTMYRIMQEWEETGFDFEVKSKDCIEKHGEIDLEKHIRILTQAQTMFSLIRQIVHHSDFNHSKEQIKNWRKEMLLNFEQIVKEVEQNEVKG